MTNEIFVRATHWNSSDKRVLQAEALQSELTEETAVIMQGCIIEEGYLEICPHGVQQVVVKAGGLVRCHYLTMRHGSIIRALPDGGMIIGACAECRPS